MASDLGAPAKSDIFNGACCKAYSWSQSHSDLEIRIKTARPVKYEDVSVVVSKRDICVEVSHDIQSEGPRGVIDVNVETLVEGCFEHPVDTDSAYWLIETNPPCIVLYVDKAEDMWWKQLLVDEDVTETGPKSYTVPMDHLDNGSRMMIEKLIVEQRNKMTSKEDNYSSA